MKQFIDTNFRRHPFVSFLITAIIVAFFAWIWGVEKVSGQSAQLSELASIGSWFQGTLGLAVAFAGSLVAIWLAISALAISENAEKRENYRLRYEIIKEVFDKLNTLSRSLKELHEVVGNSWIIYPGGVKNDLMDFQKFVGIKDSLEREKSNLVNKFTTSQFDSIDSKDKIKLILEEIKLVDIELIDISNKLNINPKNLSNALKNLANSWEDAKSNPYSYFVLNTAYRANSNTESKSELNRTRQEMKKRYEKEWDKFEYAMEGLVNWDSLNIFRNIALQDSIANISKSSITFGFAETAHGKSFSDIGEIGSFKSFKARAFIFTGCLLGSELNGKTLYYWGLRYLEDMVMMLSKLSSEEIYNIVKSSLSFITLEKNVEKKMEDHLLNLFDNNNPKLITKELFKQYKEIESLDGGKGERDYPLFKEMVKIEQ